MSQTAWLVETTEDCSWLCCIDGDLTFSKDPDKVLRFARKEDAEAMCTLFIGCIATEHSWMDV